MEKKTNCTYIGGQAVIEGVMMRGKRAMATVVRDENGDLHTEARRGKPPEERSRFSRAFFVRGIVNFVSSLAVGMGALMRSSDAALASDEGESSKFSKWLSERFKISAGDIMTTLSMIVGIALALVLFMFCPNWFTEMIAKAAPAIGSRGSIWYSLIEGGFRLLIFLGYVLLTLLIPSVRRTYMYHGAEHKTINCYELGKELTAENVKSCSRLHDRCGTTFIFIVLVISILVYSLVNWLVAGVMGLNTGIAALDFMILFMLRLLFLPIVAGISYEILKLLAKIQSPVVLPLKAPGYLMQLLTTREPDDGMIECAILSFKKVLEMDENPAVPEKLFATETKMLKLLETIKKNFAQAGIDESDAEWIVSISLGITRGNLKEERVVTKAECEKILSVYEERLTGRPLWYIYGDTDFYGYTLKVDERVLIPRPETEILVRHAVTALSEGDSLLDLCTGSGAIAIACALEAAKDKNVSVTAADISEGALEVARENARTNKANVRFVKSDLFENVRGRFNVITANPPYVPSAEIETLSPDVRDFEPRLALDGGADGLDFYRRIAEKIGRYILHGGLCILEVGEDQAQEVIKIFRETARCDFAMVVKDLEGVDRIVKIGF